MDANGVRPMDDDDIREMVETHTKFAETMWALDLDLGTAFEYAFISQCAMIMGHLPKADKMPFLDKVDVEKKRLADEKVLNREAYLRRLDVFRVPLPAEPAPQYVRQRQGMNDLVARTAVRATVWQLIGGMFRVFK